MAEHTEQQRRRVPQVSVILPAYNRASFLAIAISSVISQSVDEWELIVADDGSGEEARACLRSISHPAVRVIELAHCGNPAEVRNVALAAAATPMRIQPA